MISILVVVIPSKNSQAVRKNVILHNVTDSIIWITEEGEYIKIFLVYKDCLVRNIGIINEHKCYGCEACVETCSEDCIALEFNSEGFLNPIGDDESCIECKKYLKVCPVLVKYQIEISNPPLVKVVKSSTLENRLKSISVGANW